MIMIAKILLFLQVVAIGAGVGAVATFFGLILLGTLAGASQMEGGLAMGAAGLAPIGALVGAAIGALLAWRMLSRLSEGAIWVGGCGLATLVVFAVGGWFVVEEMTDGNPYGIENEPTVHIEWRLPEAVQHNMVDRIFRFSMRSTYMDWSLTTQWDEPRVRDENGVSILRRKGFLRWREAGRQFQQWRAPHHDDRITVELGLGDDPDHQSDYGPWREVSGHAGYAFRTRVVKNP